MSTSGDDPRSAVLYVLFAVLATLLALRWARARDLGTFLWPPPLAATVLWLIVAVPSLLRVAVPALDEMFRRNPVQIRNDGEWWRIGTSVLVQDGGAAAIVANLVLLAVLAVAGVRVWGPGRALALFAGGQLMWGLFTSFVSPSAGAGCSAAAFALAAATAGLWLSMGARRLELAVSLAILAIGALLLLIDDAHGVAVLCGMLLGAVLGTVMPPTRPVSAAAVGT
ncbi:rhomboid family intramembrane serine protease [Rhodococcus sp. HM1]|uniref:rhomboid family intramembrane serine protease n=1 Tax=unclassified Rhodococcus (in: high G+C Gram-positive bacteria) TaxID=192944 RepID=UPI0018CF34E8|nr:MULTISPECIES: rhomboid family intramembrane serine protease [unclassified Rhodococcus (in: high G+C Gram-positive bacteria)]MBH0118113.1 rhomboid family intramembrane serine protease [Rhodococcus sp. CX]MCK8674706.1 rhomboid family intramembrane serine protease [Rhodococcus sp. HM1]